MSYYILIYFFKISLWYNAFVIFYRCAFMNTPKYNQVKGKGKIVTRKWLEECHSERKKLPWRRFALDKNDKKHSESEDEILEEVITDNNEDNHNDDFLEQYDNILN